MRSRNATISLIVILLFLAIFLVRRWQEPRKREYFDRSPPALSYTRHAVCRMECRSISRGEVDEILKKGVIMYNRSNMRARPCPVFALQGRTSDGDYIRVIFAQCREETRVVTTYNLEKEFACDCPGDESKK